MVYLSIFPVITSDTRSLEIFNNLAVILVYNINLFTLAAIIA
jgi:hypothetical protein